MIVGVGLALAAALAVVLPAAPAHAQANHTYVSGAGSDDNPCTFASPCRTLQAAYNVTAADGEIEVLVPANYSPLTITPVSYTHLRAHETDSYLVCRLLLEKKKK